MEYLNDLSDIDPRNFEKLFGELNIKDCYCEAIDTLLISLYQRILSGTPLTDTDALALRDVAIKIEYSSQLSIHEAHTLMSLAQI